MNYRIDVDGMHCAGCETLIKMSLEEAELLNVEVSLKNKSATFETENDISEVKKILDTVFSVFTDYTYSNLEQLNNVHS